MAPTPAAAALSRRRQARGARGRWGGLVAKGVAMGIIAIALQHAANRWRRTRAPDASEYPAHATNMSVMARGLVTRRATAASILNEHDTYFYNTTVRATEGKVIAFLSAGTGPGVGDGDGRGAGEGNGAGGGGGGWRLSWTLAERFRGKLTHVAPHWFDLGPDASTVSRLVSTWGAATWAQRVKRPPAEAGAAWRPPRLTPLVSFAGVNLSRVLGSDGSEAEDALRARRAAGALARACAERRWCDGLILDAHGPLCRADGTEREADEPRPNSTERIRSWANAVTEHVAALLASASPARVAMVRVPPLKPHCFGRKDMSRVGPVVDGVIVRTWGLSGTDRPGPDAPLPWMLHALQGLLEDQSLAQGLVATLNFGGFDFVQPVGGGALRNRSRYLHLLRTHAPALEWYPEAAAHVFTYRDAQGRDRSVYYPSLRSIQDRLVAARGWGVGLAIEELSQGLDYWMDLF